jgi:hypothetical protein
LIYGVNNALHCISAPKRLFSTAQGPVLAFKMFNLASLSLSLYCSVLFGLAAAYLLITSVAQYWRLRHIPGPPLAAWTNLWLIRAMHHKVNFHIQEERLHQRYGPVQRYGPNRVLFSDPAAISVILGSTNIFPKVGVSIRKLLQTLEVNENIGSQPRPRKSLRQRLRSPLLHRRNRRRKSRPPKAQPPRLLLRSRRPSLRATRQPRRHRNGVPSTRQRPHCRPLRVVHVVRIRHHGAHRIQRGPGLHDQAAGYWRRGGSCTQALRALEFLLVNPVAGCAPV